MQQRQVIQWWLGLALAILLVLPLAAQNAASDWPQFRGGPMLTGVAARPVGEDLELLWTHDTGDAIDSSAAIVEGTVYAGVGNGDLIALDFDTGALKWTYSTGSFIGESSPTVANGTVYIGDLDGVLHAVRADNGERIWTFETETEIKASAVVAEGVVLIGSYDTFLYAVEESTGTLRWKLQTDGQLHATPAVRDGLAYIAGCDGTFRAIRVADGTEEYQIFIGAYTGASPLLVGDRAYFGTYEYEVLALDLTARDVVWRYSNPGREFPFYSSATYVDGMVVTGGRDKIVHAIDAETGEARWTFTTLARVDSSPVLAGDRIFVGSSDGRLYALDPTTGESRWEFNAGAALTASPAVAYGRLVIGATDGVIYAFE